MQDLKRKLNSSSSSWIDQHNYQATAIEPETSKLLTENSQQHQKIDPESLNLMYKKLSYIRGFLKKVLEVSRLIHVHLRPITLLGQVFSPLFLIIRLIIKIKISSLEFYILIFKIKLIFFT